MVYLCEYDVRRNMVLGLYRTILLVSHETDSFISILFTIKYLLRLYIKYSAYFTVLTASRRLIIDTLEDIDIFLLGVGTKVYEWPWKIS